MISELFIVILVLLFIIFCYNNEFKSSREEIEEYRKENDILNKELKKIKRENEAQKDTIKALTETINDFDIEEV